jgi:DDE superfamily endonuclease
MQLHLDEIATKVTPGAHAILVLDQAGWHGAKDLKVPSNISLLPLPPRAPELNSQENIWQFVRQNWLSNRIFKSFDGIVPAVRRASDPNVHDRGGSTCCVQRKHVRRCRSIRARRHGHAFLE